jgi:hypothetical protein
MGGVEPQKAAEKAMAKAGIRIFELSFMKVFYEFYAVSAAHAPRANKNTDFFCIFTLAT